LPVSFIETAHTVRDISW